MALVESVAVELGTAMPPLSLKDAWGKPHDDAGLYGPKGLLVAFTCNHCPYAVAVWPRLVRLAQWARGLGVHAAAVNPNIHPGYPEDAPARMQEKVSEWSISFPYLVDETQGAAKAFKAQCTPDLYLFDSARKLFYHGRIDDDWKDESKVRRHELKEAVERLARGEAPPPGQRPSMGCSIKWK